jgi:hypothetical protein
MLKVRLLHATLDAKSFFLRSIMAGFMPRAQKAPMFTFSAKNNTSKELISLPRITQSAKNNYVVLES